MTDLSVRIEMGLSNLIIQTVRIMSSVKYFIRALVFKISLLIKPERLSHKSTKLLVIG